MSEKDDGKLASVGRRPTGFESEVRFFFLPGEWLTWLIHHR